MHLGSCWLSIPLMAIPVSWGMRKIVHKSAWNQLYQVIILIWYLHPEVLSTYSTKTIQEVMSNTERGTGDDLGRTVPGRRAIRLQEVLEKWTSSRVTSISQETYTACQNVGWIHASTLDTYLYQSYIIQSDIFSPSTIHQQHETVIMNDCRPSVFCSD